MLVFHSNDRYWLDRFGLRIIDRKIVKFSKLYIRYYPLHPLNNEILKTPIDRLITNSFYAKMMLRPKNRRKGYRGKSFFIMSRSKSIRETDYYKYLRAGGGDPAGKIRRMDSLYNSLRKKGYLGGKFSESYIVILNESLAFSRFKIKENHLYPEIFAGHHRIAIMLSLGITEAEVLVAEDAQRGTMQLAEDSVGLYCRLAPYVDGLQFLEGANYLNLRYC